MLGGHSVWSLLYDDGLLRVAATWAKLSVSFVDSFSPCIAEVFNFVFLKFGTIFSSES